MEADAHLPPTRSHATLRSSTSSSTLVPSPLRTSISSSTLVPSHRLAPISSLPAVENVNPQQSPPHRTPPKRKPRALFTEQNRFSTPPSSTSSLSTASDKANVARQRALRLSSEVDQGAPAADVAKAELAAVAAFQEWHEARREVELCQHNLRNLHGRDTPPPPRAPAPPAATPTPPGAKASPPLRIADASAVHHAVRTPRAAAKSTAMRGRASPASAMISRIRRTPGSREGRAPYADLDRHFSDDFDGAMGDESRRSESHLPQRSRPAPPTTDDDDDDDAAHGPGGCARCCCLLLCNLWVLLAFLSATAPSILLADSFPANEIDNWYAARMCPRHAGGGAPSFEQYEPLDGIPPGASSPHISPCISRVHGRC